MKNINYCKVCGYELSGQMFSICDCCGTQANYEDLDIESIRQLRTVWISKGMPWFNEQSRPADWNPNDQLKNIIKE